MKSLQFTIESFQKYEIEIAPQAGHHFTPTPIITKVILVAQWNENVVKYLSSSR